MHEHNKSPSQTINAHAKSTIDIVNAYNQVVGTVSEYVNNNPISIASSAGTKLIKKTNIIDIPEELDYPGQEVRILIPATNSHGNITDNEKLAFEFIYNEEGDLVEFNEPEGVSFDDPHDEHSICYLEMGDDIYISPLIQSKYKNLKKRLQKNKALKKKRKLKKDADKLNIKPGQRINIHISNINNVDINDTLKKMLSILQANPSSKTLEMLRKKLLAYDLSKLPKDSAAYIQELSKTIDRIKKYTHDNDSALPKNKIREFFKAIENAVREQDLLAQQRDYKEFKGVLHGILKRYNLTLGKAKHNKKNLSAKEKAKLSGKYKDNTEEKEWEKEDLEDDKKIRELWKESYSIEDLAKEAILYRNAQINRIQEILDDRALKLTDEERIDLELAKAHHTIRIGEHQLLMVEVGGSKIDRNEELNHMHSIAVKQHNLEVLSENKIVDHYEIHKEAYKSENTFNKTQLEQLHEIAEQYQAGSPNNQAIVKAANELSQAMDQIQTDLRPSINSEIPNISSNVGSADTSKLSNIQDDKQQQSAQEVDRQYSSNMKQKSSHPIMEMPQVTFDMAKIKRSASKHILSQDNKKQEGEVDFSGIAKNASKHRASISFDNNRNIPYKDRHLKAQNTAPNRGGKNNLPER